MWREEFRSIVGLINALCCNIHVLAGFSKEDLYKILTGYIDVIQHDSTKHSSRPTDHQEKKPFQKDPSEPSKYAEILVIKKREWD